MTDQYAVMGNPIAHSLSPLVHTQFAKQTKQDLTYKKILVSRDAFVNAVTQFIQLNGCGLNITLPFKVEAYHLVDRMTERAKFARAINTIKIDKAGLFGDNTDGIGLLRDVQDHLGFSVKGKRVLILGAGGAARGVLSSLLFEQPKLLFVANRTPEKAHVLIKHCSTETNLAAGCFEDLKDQCFDLIINATSSSLQKIDLPLPENIFDRHSLGYDMVFGAKATTFMRWSKAHGATQVSDGMGMLVEQAAESFKLWRGVMPDTAPVLAYLKQTTKQGA